MKNKKINIILLLATLLAIIGIPNLAKAAELNPNLYFGIQEMRTESDPHMAFSIGEPGHGTQVKDKSGSILWKIVKHSSQSASQFDNKANIYCVKGDIGFSKVSDIGTYTDVFDFVKDRTTMQSYTTDTVLQSLVKEDANTKYPDRDPYYAIIALSDLIYVKGSIDKNGAFIENKTAAEDKKALLKKAGVPESEFGLLTDDMIDAIQQAAFWYFTNHDSEIYDRMYARYNENGDLDGYNWFFYKLEEGEGYQEISDYTSNPSDRNEAGKRTHYLYQLYNYLVKTTLQNIQLYKGGKKLPQNKITLFTNVAQSKSTQPVIVIEKVKTFDLALRKYITQIDDTILKNVERTREPSIDDSTIATEETATYKHRKDAEEVKQGSIITYNITIYNEGNKAGYATKIIDQLPTGLEFVQDSQSEGFTAAVDDANRITFTRNKQTSDQLDAYIDGTIDSETITFQCKVTQKPHWKDKIVLTNVAWIAEEYDAVAQKQITNTVGDDRDSEPQTAPNVGKDTTSNYKGSRPDDKALNDKDFFYQGEQDDDDFESVVLMPKAFDLRLKKTINMVNETEIEERILSVNVDGLKDGSNTDATFNMNKNPVVVKTGDIVKYRLRVYNEGERDGYASQISEDIPEGLEFIDGEVEQATSQLERDAITYNKKVWKALTTNQQTHKVEMVTTDYLAKGNGEDQNQDGANLIKAFDKSKGYVDSETEKNPDYRDIYIYMKVISENASGTNIRNEAAITEDADEVGDTVDDRDSNPKEWPGKENQQYQDDEDYDVIVLQTFDLALRKYITKVGDTVLAGTEKTRNPEVETSTIATSNTATYQHRKDPVPVEKGDIVTYNITIYNEGQNAGYATQIVDQLPEGLIYHGMTTQGFTPSYDAETNRLTLTRQAERQDTLAGYTTGELKSETITIECEVTQKPDWKDQIVLTNVAWITEEYDAVRQKRITDVEGDDRDSEPAKHPQVAKDTMEDYTGKEGNNTNLANPEEFYQGEQDDDDFEKLVVMPKKFDLALRKYITKVDDTVLEEQGLTRIPDIETSTIAETGTATYNHRKNPVIVHKGSIVTYNITVYNEGEKAGYATKIIDQLPEGLKYSKIISEGYTVAYDEQANRVTFTRKAERTDNLPAYTTGLPKSETIIFECEVTQKPILNDEIILTNVAWIEEEVNVEDNLTITNTQGQDRDSEPATAPEVAKNTMENYTGKEGNNSNLANPEEFYEGQQDDDDFEKVKLMPNNFDLALRKYITKVGETVLADEEKTRVPDVDTSTLPQNKTATYKHRKDPVEVEQGDRITYDITIYNEGDRPGYATKVVDQLPTGLKFIGIVESKGFTASYDEETNQITFTRTPERNDVLSAYTTGKPASETITIECEVTQKPDENEPIILTNVAWIAEEFNSQDKITITNTEGDDRDSEPGTAPDVNQDTTKDYRGSTPDDQPLDDPNHFYPGEQDDDDFESVVVKPKKFDLRLKKSIYEVNGEVIPERINSIDVKGLQEGTSTDATIEMNKEPVEVKKGDMVKYRLRVYNEGERDGYAEEISEDIPKGLEFIEGEIGENTTQEEKEAMEYNQKVWKVSERNIETKRVEMITTDQLARGKGEEATKEGANLLKAFDKSKGYVDTETEKNPDYRDVYVYMKVVSEEVSGTIIRNEAAITEDADKDGGPVEDRDSKPEEWPGKEKQDYQDEEDYDNVVLQSSFDLALRKFITKVGKDEVNTRIPQVSYDKETDQITYNHPKDTVDVAVGDVVEYTIRVFNEGSQDGYAAEVLDDIPDGLEFLPENKTNTDYRWVMYREVEAGEQETDKAVTHDGKTYVETQNASEADIIVTDYLSMEQGEARMGENETENPALLKAFDPSAELSDTNPDHADVVAAFKVVQPEPSDKTIVNHAQISKDTDDKGNDIEDDDSEPDQWNEGEDDQDQEAIKPKYFDLALRKWVTQSIVIENGKQTVTPTGHTPEQDPEPIVKVDLDRKKLNQVTVKFRYSIRVTNEGDIAGYAKEVTDYVPEGLKFVAEDNPGWQDAGNNVIKTNLLADRLLQPGESADVEVVLTWINQQDNMGLKTNTAEISKDENDRGVPDRDSTPNNKKQGEDDIDDAPVMLSIKTGKATTYIILGVTILTIFASGIALIRKYVR